MTKLEFIIRLLELLIWPVTIFIILFIIRKPLKDLMPFLKRAKISELELEFDRELAKVKSVAEDEFKSLKTDWKTDLLNLAQNFPNAAILEAWKEIENRTEALIHKSEPKLNLDVSTRYKLMQNVLTEENIIETKKAKIFNDLRQIRNKVAHANDYTVSKDQALNFISISVQLIEYLEEKIHTGNNKITINN